MDLDDEQDNAYTLQTLYIYIVYDLNLKVARQLPMAACARAYDAPEPG